MSYTDSVISIRCVSSDALQSADLYSAGQLTLRGGFEATKPMKQARFAKRVTRKRVITAKKSSSKAKSKTATDAIAGALARAASQSTIHPLDTIKVQMQAGTFGTSVSKFGKLVPPNLGAQAVIPGITSLYRGVVGAASGAGIAIGAYFALYSSTTRAIEKHCKNMSPAAVAFTAGAIAAAGGSLVKVPLAVCIRSVQAGIYPNVFNASQQIIRAAGVKGLFTGFLPTFLEDVPDMAVKFAAYESLRQMHSKFHKGAASTPQEDLVMGGVSGSLAAAATTPLDVIKTRMMCSAASSPSVIGATRSIMAEKHALKAFFSGVGPRALSNGVNTAVFFCFFEAIKVALEMHEKRSQEGEARKSLKARISQAEVSSSPKSTFGQRGSGSAIKMETLCASPEENVDHFFPEGQLAPMGASISMEAVSQHKR